MATPPRYAHANTRLRKRYYAGISSLPQKAKTQIILYIILYFTILSFYSLGSNSPQTVSNRPGQPVAASTDLPWLPRQDTRTLILAYERGITQGFHHCLKKPKHRSYYILSIILSFYSLGLNSPRMLSNRPGQPILSKSDFQQNRRLFMFTHKPDPRRTFSRKRVITKPVPIHRPSHSQVYYIL